MQIKKYIKRPRSSKKSLKFKRKIHVPLYGKKLVKKGGKQDRKGVKFLVEKENLHELRKTPTHIESGVRKVFKSALISGKVCFGLESVTSKLDKKKALLCALAKDAPEPYLKFIEGLCKTNSIPLYMVDTAVKLGEWVGLCRWTYAGKQLKKTLCRSAVVIRHGNDEKAKYYVERKLISE